MCREMGWKEGEREERGEHGQNELAVHSHIKPCVALKAKPTYWKLCKMLRLCWAVNAFALCLSGCVACNQCTTLSDPVTFVDCLVEACRLRKASGFTVYNPTFKQSPFIKAFHGVKFVTYMSYVNQMTQQNNIKMFCQIVGSSILALIVIITLCGYI